MRKSLIIQATFAGAAAIALTAPASAAVIFDPIPFDIPGGLGQQVHSSGAQTDDTVFGFLSPGDPLGVTIKSPSTLMTNGSGHAVIDGPFDQLEIFFTQGQVFNAIEFNIAAVGSGQDITSGIVTYFLSGGGSGSFNFNAGTGQNKIRIYGDAGELFSKISFDATASTYASIRQIDFGGVQAIPEPATWAMMILGFGIVGFLVRASRRRGANTALA